MQKNMRTLKRLHRIARRILGTNASIGLSPRKVIPLIEAGFRFITHQARIRPRLRLFSKLLIILVLSFALSNQVAFYLKQKEQDVVVNGHRILAARESTTQENKEHIELDQAVSVKRNPFDFRLPVIGYLSQGYSFYHRANDIASSFGSPIHPVGSGVVQFAGYSADGHGNMVVIDHGDGLVSSYAHMDKIYVGSGNMVSSEATIGTIGLTGRTTGPHVHLEILDNGIAINPAAVLP